MRIEKLQKKNVNQQSGPMSNHPCRMLDSLYGVRQGAVTKSIKIGISISSSSDPQKPR